MSAQLDQPGSKFGKSIVTLIATAQTNVTIATTPLSAQCRQVRLAHNMAGGIHATFGSAATVTTTTANYIPVNVPEYFSVTPGQVLNFISSSTSTGWVTLTEMS
jgi:hypothetical protein